ncbi:peptidoglycan-binding domain-containing protein, partial [Pallidibacillus thermolactis]|uniref:peptidoglycan-binding domain-containing protein n=1 Tax=Pallidibacillus thermolactis TaxID=251051 RepID=UPI002E22F531|nr:peptidoglycan-binding protein [Pallidibacillus thermolactis subsp. kokeshiiformis]
MKGLKAAIAIASFLFYTILISTNVTVAADNPIHDEEQKQQIEIEEEIPEEEKPILESFEEIEQSSEVEIEDQDINRPKELVETDKDISKEVDNKIEAPSSREEVDTNVIVNANSINLKVGDSGKEVYDLKLKLAQLGFPVSANPNEDYGLKTAATVKEFQIYYGLKATGEADAATMAKIDEILSSPYRLGKSSSAVKQLKLNLAKIGFVVSDQPNNDYGPKTEAVVKEFQRLNGLKVNGIADEVTLAKINEWLNGELKMGMSGPRVLKLKQDLANLGFVVSNNPNEDYGPKTSAVVKEFQLYYGLKTTGEADGATLAKIEEVLSSTYRIGLSSPQVKTLKLNLATLGFQVSDNPNNDYGPKTATVVKEFQRYYGLRATGIADEVTLKKIDDMLSSPY